MLVERPLAQGAFWLGAGYYRQRISTLPASYSDNRFRELRWIAEIALGQVRLECQRLLPVGAGLVGLA